MKIVYFKKNDQPAVGILTVNGILDVDAYQQCNGRKIFSGHNIRKSEIKELKNIIEDALLDDRFFLEESSVTFCPSSPKPSKIICIGLNYSKHAVESGMAVPTVPVVFTKYNNTLINYGNDVPLGKVGE